MCRKPHGLEALAAVQRFEMVVRLLVVGRLNFEPVVFERDVAYVMNFHVSPRYRIMSPPTTLVGFYLPVRRSHR